MKVYPCEWNTRRRTSSQGAKPRRFPYHVKAGLFLLGGAILAAPSSTVLTSCSGMSTGVFAAPCTSDSSTTAGGGAAQQVYVSNTNDLDLTSHFDCEDGELRVYWSGKVNVTGTIVIGVGTTVTISGDANSSEGNSSLDGNEALEELTSQLALPLGLTSAVVGVGPSNITFSTEEEDSFGPLFYVDGGVLHLEDLIVRGGFAANTTDGLDGVGGGVYAINSNVTVTRCEFNDNFAENLGGGIFANESTLIVVDSMFRGCEAGFVSTFDDGVVNGAGGGIATQLSDLWVEGCLFEGGYANQKGGGVSHQGGSMTIVDSVFYNNSAGGKHIEHEDITGQGAGLSVSECHRSFNGLAACGVNDTVFTSSSVAKQGGAVALSTGIEPWVIELHRCTIDNSSTGAAIKNDNQGEGGAISVDLGVTLILSDCTLRNNYCGKKGGAVVLNPGEDWISIPGAVVTVRNSSFENNTADLNNGGVVNVGGFATLTIEGDANVFKGNSCGEDGGVLAATTNTSVAIEGGTFSANRCSRSGGVLWSKGSLSIEDGVFSENESEGEGGVMFASEFGVLTVKCGVFEKNRAVDGGVALVHTGSVLLVDGGVFTGNAADRQGGAFSVNDRGVIEITGGNFTNNMAVNGGFLYKQGEGSTACTGASILEHQGVNGGAIHAVDGATLHWACHIGNNSALSGPAIYARDDTTVELRAVSLFDNSVARGSVVFLINSVFKTYQVEFVDSSGSLDLSAVQVDQASSYMAEDTSFIGFEGEAVVFSEGELYLDDCDFSASNASVLVYSKPDSVAVIRNAALGDLNYYAVAKAGSEAGELPDAASLTNAKLKCGDGDGHESSPCSEGSACREGDLGVYCQCYYPELSNSTERCVSVEAIALNLEQGVHPQKTFFPQLLQGSLLLSYEPTSSSSAASGSSSSSSSSGSDSGGDGTESGVGEVERSVVWSVEATGPDPTMMNWTVFPSAGLIRPGETGRHGHINDKFTIGYAKHPGILSIGYMGRTQAEVINLTVASLPGTYFEGLQTVVFTAVDVGSQFPTTATSASFSSDGDGKNEDNSYSAAPQESSTEGASITAIFDVEFYHCKAGSFWNRTISSLASPDKYTGTCEPCSEDELEGDTEGIDCSQDGETLQTLLVKEGYWRATLDLSLSRECFNEDACKGGSNVAGVQDYCNDGYEGVVCSVCSSGYGRGAANQCHECTEGFKGGVFFFLSVAALFALVVIAQIGVYLVGGGGAVSSTVSSTKQSVIQLQRRGAGILSRPDGDGATGFGQNVAGLSVAPGSRPDGFRGVGRKSTTPGDGAGGNEELACDGQGPNERDVIVEAPGDNVSDQGGNTMAARIGAFLNGLPLAKLKIVIVVWQISGAELNRSGTFDPQKCNPYRGMTHITHVGFPPIYDKFLSIIGVFSLDLGWLLSATCVAVGVDFYAKLLIVTIGPIILLGLLGVTFYLGSRPARPRAQSLDDLSGGMKQRRTLGNRISSTKAKGTSERMNGESTDTKCGDSSAQGQASGGGEGVTSETDKPPARRSGLMSGVQNSWVIHMSGQQTGNRQSPAPRGRANRPVATRERSLRGVWKAGPGDKTDPEQVHLWELFARHTTMTLVILYLVYSQVSTVVFQTFGCDEYPEIHERHLRADSRIECGTATHNAYRVYAAVMICLYPFGIPAAFLYMLHRQRSAINPPTDKGLEDSKGKQYVVQAKINQRANDESVAPTSFLWGAYYPSCYYFEVFECMRRLLLTGLLVFVPNPSGQVAYSCIFAFVSLVAFEIQMPHIDGLEIQLYRTGCLVIFFTNFLALIIQTDLADENSGGSAVYSVLLILVHVFFVLSICWNSWVTMKATLSRRHIQGVVLGVDLIDEENADKILGSRNKDEGTSKSDHETKAEDVEELPSWQDKPAVPELAFETNSSGSRRGDGTTSGQPGTSKTAAVPSVA